MDDEQTISYSAIKVWLFSAILFQFVAAIAVIIIVKYYPGLLVRLFRWWTCYSSGYAVKIFNDPKSLNRFIYIEKGSLEDCEHSLVFLHGFGDTKEGFCTAGKYFPTSVHTVSLDLPGHGAAKMNGPSSMSADDFVTYVKEFIDAVGLSKKKIHLAGHSMGGGLTCMYASAYPDDVLSVIFVAPAGTIQDEKSTLEKMAPNQIYSLMVPRTTTDFRKLLNFLTYKKLSLPDFILSALLEDGKSGSEFRESLLKSGEMFRSRPQEEFPNVKKPALCIWGDEDQITHVSGSGFVKKAIPQSNVVIMEKCGHAVLLDRPKELAMHIMEFLQKQQ